MPDQVKKLPLEPIGANPDVEFLYFAVVVFNQELAIKGVRTRRALFLQGSAGVAAFWTIFCERSWADGTDRTDVVERVQPDPVEAG